MPYTQHDTYIGLPFIGFVGATTISTTADAPLGTISRAFDPYWGAGEFIYLKAGATLVLGNLCIYDGTYTVTTVPNTANLGKSLVVALQAMTSGQYGWFQVTGTAVLSATTTVANDTTFGITAAGQVGTLAAGKQVLNAKSVLPSATTVVKSCQIVSGSPTMTVPNFDGWFVGITLTGTGISGTVTALNVTDRTVTMSANATVTGPVSATGTYTGFIGAEMDRPFAQGAIT